MTTFMDLTGQVFGHLTALHYHPRSKWECRCACGKSVTVFAKTLRDGRVTSCGCQPRPVASERCRGVMVAPQVVALLIETPGLTSREIADRLGLPCFSLMTVLSDLARKGIVATADPSPSLKHWTAATTLEAIPALLEKRVEAPISNRRKDSPTPMGLTQEDEQWMQHYRSQWLRRYQQRGQTPPHPFD